LFDKEKPSYRSYKEHLNYLLQIDAAGGGHYSRNVLTSMVALGWLHLKVGSAQYWFVQGLVTPKIKSYRIKRFEK
jgi:hypothetical protein